jgi:hypothetical protein
MELVIAGFIDFVHRPVFLKKTRENVSEIGSVSVIRRGGKETYFVGSLRKS